MDVGVEICAAKVRTRGAGNMQIGDSDLPVQQVEIDVLDAHRHLQPLADQLFKAVAGSRRRRQDKHHQQQEDGGRDGDAGAKAGN